jgi:hypothetical protein
MFSMAFTSQKTNLRYRTAVPIMSQVTSVAKGWKLRSDLQRETGFCLS